MVSLEPRFAKQFFEDAQRLPILPVEQIINRPFLVLAPHPDDESLGAGGLIALATRAGIEASIALLTDGSGSHKGSVCYPRERLARTRYAELKEAAQILGIPSSRLHALGFQDEDAPVDGPMFEASVCEIIRILRSTTATTLLVTWGGDPHCDHVSANMVAREVRRRNPSVTLWAYPVWGWHLDDSTIVEHPARGFRIDISEVKHLKREAIAAHASQMTDLISDDPEGFRFTDAMLAPFLGSYEYLIEVPD